MSKKTIGAGATGWAAVEFIVNTESVIARTTPTDLIDFICPSKIKCSV